MPHAPDMLFDDSAPMTAARAVGVYEFLRQCGVLPAIPFAPAEAPARFATLREVIASSRYDALLLDGFGVLNCGGEATPFAAAMLAGAEAAGIAVVVVTNAGSRPRDEVAARYHRLGLAIPDENIIPSRDALLAGTGHGQSPIGVADGHCALPDDSRFFALDPDSATAWEDAGEIAFLGATGWDGGWQACLSHAVAEHGAAIHIANPDVTAPIPGAFTHEPGYWAAKIIAAHPGAAGQFRWYGKPHGAVFDLALRRVAALRGGALPAKNRIAMVGDTLHTDILGGRAAGIESLLVLNHGLFRDGDVDIDQVMRQSGITPDVIVERV